MAGFFIDENLPELLVEALSGRGHTASSVSRERINGFADPDVLSFAVRRDLIVVTADLDFADINVYPVGSHSGIVVLRLPDFTPAAMAVRLLEAIDLHPNLHGCLLVVQRRRTRIRRP